MQSRLYRWQPLRDTSGRRHSDPRLQAAAMSWIAMIAIGLAVVPPLLHVSAAGAMPGKRPLVWGLDLGNDNLVMAVASRNGVDVVTNDVSGRQTPSAIYFAGDHRLIGEHSAGHAGSNPRNLINHIKFLLQDRPPPPLNVSGERRRQDPRGSRGAGSSGREEGQSEVWLMSAEEESVQQRQQQQGQQIRGSEKDTLPKQERARGVDSGQHENSDSSMTTTKKIDEGSEETDSGGDDSIAEPIFFCETRSPEDTNQAGRVAVVTHLGEELELGASETIAYLLGHCAEGVVRGSGGEGGAAGACGNEGAGATSSCVVASVPSYFSLRQRRAVLDAASIAGVPMPMVIDEGTAVALAYGILKGGLPAEGEGPPLTVAFVDIGHSCTQVTVAAFTASGLRVLGRGCAERGGTATGEAAMFDRVCRAVSGEQGLTVKGNPRAEFRLSEAVSAAMRTLSANKEARLSVDCIDGDRDIAMMLTREDVESACIGVAEGVSSACMEALRAAKLGAGDVSDVELLGGGSYIPRLRRAVENVFGGGRVRRTMSSSESVARGCALAAAQHSSMLKLRPFRITDTLPKDLRLVWRYRPGNIDKSRRNDDNDSIVPRELTGEVDVLAGTPIPWSTSVPVAVGVGERGKVHAHLMEGPDRVSSYEIDLFVPTGSAGRVIGGRAGGQGPSGEATLKFFFRVDDGGVPSVQSARLEFEEQVTEFVEIPAPAPASPPKPVPAPKIPPTEQTPSQSAADDGNADSERKEDSSSSSSGGSKEGDKKAETSEDEVTATGEREETVQTDSPEAGGDSADDQAESLTADGEVHEERGHREPGSRKTYQENGGGKEGDAGGETPPSPVGTTPENAATGAAVADNVPAEGNEHDSPGDEQEVRPMRSTSERSPEELKQQQQQEQEQQRQQQQQQGHAASTKIKVPRVVTRVRSRPLMVEQTYTGLLEGTALKEARARERALRAQDLSVRLSGEARNSLEDLVYVTRSSLEPGDGELSPFTKPSEAGAILSLLEDTEAWLYDSDGSRDKSVFEKRAASIHQKLSEPQARKQARLRLLDALKKAETAAEEGDALIAVAQGSIPGSQKRHAENELASIRRYVSDIRRKLDAVVRTGPGGTAAEYGSLVGRLPSQEEEVRKKMEQLHKAFAFVRKEHS